MSINRTAITLRIISVVVIIACFFVGIVLGNQFSVMLIYWIAGLVFGMILFGLGEVIDLLQHNADQQRGILERLAQKEKQKSPQNSFDKLA